MGTTAAGQTLASVDLELPGRFSGKVRDGWVLPDGRRLLVTSDRISAFDSIIGLVPHKGQVLTQVAAWWFDQIADLVDHHLLDVPDPNVSLCIDTTPLPVEVVVRGRLTGSTSTSLLPRYLDGERTLYGITLPDGLTAHGPLPEPIITPTTKAQHGAHDEPITSAEIVERGLVDAELWAHVCEVALAVFERGTERARAAGFALADTKYEFGVDAAGTLRLIDEVHTPDSSRFWDLDGLEDTIAAGRTPEGFDKEPVRLALRAAGFTGDGDVPELGDEVFQRTSERYTTFFERLTGTPFVPGEQPAAERIRANLASLIHPAPGA